MKHKPSGRSRHSFIQFYMDDWLAGTSRMPRLIRSVYFDICCYTWDKAMPVTPSELFLMLSDLPHGQGEQIIDSLVAGQKLERDANGAVWSPRAMQEAQRALSAWEAKSMGGRKTSASKVAAAKQEDTSSSAAIEPEPEPELEKKGEADASPKENDDEEKSKTGAIRVPKPALPGMDLIPPTWNEIARKAGLTQVTKMTEERTKRLRARTEEHGADVILAAIKTVPDSEFLLGKIGKGAWKANFDWLLQPESCLKLIEGFYHNSGTGEKNWWTV